ncbi:MAG: hypothetical protein ACOYNF_17860 [Rhodoferax sp.]
MSTLPAEALDHMVSIIVNEVDPETIILFDSHARGGARPDSGRIAKSRLMPTAVV